MKYVAAIGSRYLALVVQFGLVMLVINTLPQNEVGIYFATFGLVTTLFCLAGLGLPDGMVKILGGHITRKHLDSIGTTCLRSLGVSAVTTVILCTVGAAVALWTGQPPVFVLLAALWLFLYGMVFAVSQALVALRSPGSGSFFFYSSTNIFILGTSVPYLLTFDHPTLIGLLSFTVLAATLSLLSASIALFGTLQNYPGNAPAEGLKPAIQVGFVIALSRMLQSMLYWIPVWVATACLGASEAATIGTGGRLLIAVTAVIAALRFSARPDIVAATTMEDWATIENIGRGICTVAMTFTLLALLVLWTVGQPILAQLFSAEYAVVWPLLMVLIVGALGEAFGGPVDEILKMSGHAHIVFRTLLVIVAAEALLAAILAGQGVVAIAWSQALAFCAMYAFQVLFLHAKRGIWVLPVPSSRTGKS